MGEASSVALEGDLLVVGKDVGHAASVHRWNASGWEELASLSAINDPWQACCSLRVAVDTTMGGRVLVGYGTGGQGSSAYIYQGFEQFPVSTELDIVSSKTLTLQNYPNPFSMETTIMFSVTEAGPVSVTVFDLLGKRVDTLLEEVMPAGLHRIPFQASGLPAGMYLVRYSSRSTSRMLPVIRL